MRKGSKKPIKGPRKKWLINPKTKIEESGKIYYRPSEKRKVIKNEKFEA